MNSEQSSSEESQKGWALYYGTMLFLSTGLSDNKNTISSIICTKFDSSVDWLRREPQSLCWSIVVNLEVKAVHSEDLKIVQDDVLTDCCQLQQLRLD
jgi:hypothetical protein